MPSENLTNNDLITEILALTSYGGFIVLFLCFLILCAFGAFSFIKIIKTQKKELESLERASARREDKFLYEDIRKQLDAKITDIIGKEEHEFGEYSGTDLIERLNHELDKEEQIAHSLPIGDPESITRLRVIGDWRLELEKGLLNALSSTHEA